MANVSGYPLDAMVSDGAYNATFSVYRATETLNDSGGESKAWALVDTGVGRTRELNDSERSSDEVRKVKMSHKLYCDPTIDIQRGDVVVFTNAPTGGTETLLIIDTHLPDNVTHHYEILAKSFATGSSETPMGFDVL